MPDPKTFHFDLPDVGQPDSAPIDEQWYPGVKDAAFLASSSRIYDSISAIELLKTISPNEESPSLGNRSGFGVSSSVRFMPAD